MGRHKIDRTNKIIQSFESTKPLKLRLEQMAEEDNVSVSAVIRKILEEYFEERKPR